MPGQAPAPAEPNLASSPGPVILISGPPGAGKSTVARLVAAAFERSVHLDADNFMASIVSGWVDPNRPEADRQNEAVGGALAVSAMGFAGHGYATLVSGHLFPDGVAGLAAACRQRGLSCHYAVLDADLDTCWARATARGEGRWPLAFEPFARLHERFVHADLDDRHRIDATRSAGDVSDAVLAAFRAGLLVVGGR